MKKIYIRTIGRNVHGICDSLIPRIQDAFQIETGALHTLEVPTQAYAPERGQYLSTAFFSLLESGLPQDTLRILGITNVDLYVPRLSFVFGEAKLGGPSAVISTHRLRPEYYHEPHDEEKFLRRVETEAVHELGHTFSLTHCPNPHCVMYFSNTIVETDRKGPGFCEECSSRLREAFRRQTAGFTRSGGSSE